jgi:hypothetical protein
VARVYNQSLHIVLCPYICIYIPLCISAGLKHNPWVLLYNQWYNMRGSSNGYGGLTTFINARGHMAIRPGAEAVRGWRALNRPTVCTVGAVAPGAGFIRLKMRVSQVHSRGVRIVEPETTSLKRETSRRPNFFIFRPIEVPKEPRQGFWDAGKPLEQSV